MESKLYMVVAIEGDYYLNGLPIGVYDSYEKAKSVLDKAHEYRKYSDSYYILEFDINTSYGKLCFEGVEGKSRIENGILVKADGGYNNG